MSRNRASWHWLIVKDTASEMEIFTLRVRGSQRVLPVFGSEDTATRMLPASREWRVRKTGCGELISILCGPCSEVTLVAVDPSPELVEAGMVGLVSERTDGFVDTLLRRGHAWFCDSLASTPIRRGSRSRRLWSVGTR